MKGMNGRYYMGRMIMAEYSPVTDFREAKCRQYKEGTCERGGFCNFMHPKPVNRDLKKHLYKWMYDSNPKYREDRRKRKEEEEENGGAESPAAERPKERERRRSRSRSQEKDRHHRVDKERREGREDRHRGRDDDRADRGDRDRDRDRRRSDRGDRDRREDRHRRDDDDKDKRRRDHDRDRRDRSPRRHRSRSKDRVTPSKPAGGEGDIGKRVVRMSSEERRAMIAGWAVADEVNDAPKDETIA